MLTWVGVAIALALLLLNVRELVYLRDKQRDAVREYGAASWLVGIIQRSNWSTTAVGAGLITLVVIRQLFGVQAWSPLVYALLIIWLLAIPVLRGFEWRRRDR